MKRTAEFDLLGCPVSDYASGELVGWVKCVVYDRPHDLVARIGIERERSPAPHPEPLEALEAPEPRPECDYMVGQVAAITLTDPAGRPIVAAGEPISPTVLETARRHGLLHRLEATFG